MRVPSHGPAFDCKSRPPPQRGGRLHFLRITRRAPRKVGTIDTCREPHATTAESLGLLRFPSSASQPWRMQHARHHPRIGLDRCSTKPPARPGTISPSWPGLMLITGAAQPPSQARAAMLRTVTIRRPCAPGAGSLSSPGNTQTAGCDAAHPWFASSGAICGDRCV